MTEKSKLKSMTNEELVTHIRVKRARNETVSGKEVQALLGAYDVLSHYYRNALAVIDTLEQAAVPERPENEHRSSGEY